MTPENIVDTAIEKGLSIISITDHNECQNSDVAIRYAVGKSILVIPGVELSTPQGHLLLYFDTFQHLHTFMGQVTIHENRVTCLTSIVECLNKAKNLGGFGVLAHIDTEAGFESTIGSYNPQLEAIIKHENLVGLEISNKTSIIWYTDADTSDKADDRKRVAQMRLKALNLEQYDSLPKLMSSDAHTIEKLGRNIDNEAKLTRLKMNELSYESFRIALCSGSSRVRIENDLPDVVPCFESITLEGGLLDKQTVKFSNNLTCIIGGRGTGKSTMLECVRVCSGNTSEASVVDSEVWPDVITLDYIDEQGVKHTFRKEKNSIIANLTDQDGFTTCPIEWYGQGDTAKTIEKSEENPIHLIKFLNDFVDLNAVNFEDEEICEKLRNNQSDLTQLRLDVKQKPEVLKLKANFDAQLKQLQQDKVKELVEFHIALAKEREIRKNVIEELNNLIKKYSDILSDKTVFDNFKGIDTAEIKIGSEEIEKVKQIVEEFGQIVSTKNLELIGDLKIKIEELKIHISNWKAKDAEIQQKIDAKRVELEAKGIPFDLGKINKIINDSIIYANKLKSIEQKEKTLKEKILERRDLVNKRIELSSKRFQLHQIFARQVTDSLRNNVDDFFVTLKYAEAKHSPTFVNSLQSLCSWRNKEKLEAIIKSKSPLELAQAAIRNDFSFMNSINDTNGNPLFSTQDRDAFLQKCLENHSYEDLESEKFDDLPTITVAKKIKNEQGQEK